MLWSAFRMCRNRSAPSRSPRPQQVCDGGEGPSTGSTHNFDALDPHVSVYLHFPYNPPPMLPYLTTDFPGVGGVIKQRAEDFFVQEIPLYEPSGEGEHLYCEIQKVGMTTFDAVNQLSRIFDVNSRDIGFAGMKDAKA